MTKTGMTALVLLGAVAAGVGCGSSRSTKAARDCFDAWNAPANHVRQLSVAQRFRVASVSNWRAQAAETTNVGGAPTFGCAYLFHTSSRYLSMSAEWKGHRHALRWGVPPTMRGSWSRKQQATVTDNATVRTDGRLFRR